MTHDTSPVEDAAPVPIAYSVQQCVQVPAVTETTPPSTDLGHLRLLVVEEDSTARETIVSALESCGAKVIAVDSIRDGLAEIEQQHPDLVISDLHLPDGSGDSLLRLLHQRQNLDQETPIPGVAVSSRPHSVDLDRIAEMGFKRYLAKPIHADRLIGIVASLTGRSPNPLN